MTRRRGFAALAGLLGLGAMTAGLAEQLPVALRAIAALLLVFVVPSYLLAPLFFRREPVRRPPALRLSLAFLAWLCVLALWTAILSAASVSFRDYAVASTWLLLACFGAFVVLSWRGANAALPAVPRRWWILIAACALFAAAIPFRPDVGEDGLDHIGYVRRILTDDSLRPAGVLALPIDTTVVAPPDPRKGALHGLLALVCSISGADPVTLWRWLPVLIFPVTALAALAFNTAFVGSRAMRIATSALVLVSFDGTPFRFAGASPHGESLAALWCWVMTAAALAPARPRGLLWLVLAAGGVMVHLGVAVHVLVLAATVACFGGAWGIARAQRLRMCTWMMGGIGLALLVRYADLGGEMNILHSHTQGVMFVSDRWFVASPMEILRLHGMIFLGGVVCVPALILAARTRPDARAILAAAAIPLAASFVPWIATLAYQHGSYMVFRSLLHVPAFAAIVVAAAALAQAMREKKRAAWLVGVPAALAWGLIFVRPVPVALAYDVRARAQAGRAEVRSEALTKAVAALPAGSVVLSDPATSYQLSAYTPHRFVAVYEQHGNPRDPFAIERIRAVRDVLSLYSMPDVAVAACRRFGVNYVVVNGSPPGGNAAFLSVWRPESYSLVLRRMAALETSFARMDSVGGAVIYRFNYAAPVSQAWSPPAPPVSVGAPPLAACDLAAPRDAFHVTGISISPARALPGDALSVTLGYVRDAPLPYQLPVVVHVRFDHDAVATGRAFPGEKQWRRLRDGREGKRSRFREDVVPGHGAFDPDLWPVGFELCETFTVVVPTSARYGHYHVEVSVDPLAQVPNFHVRDLLFNRDHYSGMQCATLDVVDRVVGTGESP